MRRDCGGGCFCCSWWNALKLKVRRKRFYSVKLIYLFDYFLDFTSLFFIWHAVLFWNLLTRCEIEVEEAGAAIGSTSDDSDFFFEEVFCWIVFVLFRLRLPETSLLFVLLVLILMSDFFCEILHFEQYQMSGILFFLKPAHFKWSQVSHFEHSTIGRPAKGLPQ